MRLPVHWFNMMTDEYIINSDYVTRVKQIVDWALDAGLYVILNIHHDEKDFSKVCLLKLLKLFKILKKFGFK